MMMGSERPRHDGTWQDHAACADKPTALFFPGLGEPTAPAKAICAGCPVRAQCTAEAFSLPYQDDWGIRGGLSRVERRIMRKKRNQAA